MSRSVQKTSHLQPTTSNDEPSTSNRASRPRRQLPTVPPQRRTASEPRDYPYYFSSSSSSPTQVKNFLENLGLYANHYKINRHNDDLVSSVFSNSTANLPPHFDSRRWLKETTQAITSRNSLRKYLEMEKWFSEPAKPLY